ncbi:MAG: cytochrome c biogenesis protein ResB [Sulfuricella sp.]
MFQPTLMRACRALASLELTLAALVFFAAGILIAYLGGEHTTLALVLPLLLLSLNLLAAVLTNPAFRRSGALLLFHLALIAIVLLVAAGRLTYLKGHVELSEGEAFDGRLTASEAGPWHQPGLDNVHFTNDGFSIEYAPGIQRGKTRNAVQYIDADGKEQRTEIGDQTPLVLEGYRFYTSFNKGFAPVFLWTPAAGREPILGTVHLPSYPVNEDWQARDWQLPGTDIQLWTMLKFDEIILDPNAASEFRLPHRHKVIVRIGDLQRELQPGEALDLPGGGRLVYDGLRTWMGYTVFYDWTIHWLLAACVIAVGALGWHFCRKFAAQPWNA